MKIKWQENPNKIISQTIVSIYVQKGTYRQTQKVSDKKSYRKEKNREYSILSSCHSYINSRLRAVIRAPSHPPCSGTLEWFESRPDIPEEIAAQTPSSSQSATNSRIAVLLLKIDIWTGEGRRTGCVDGARCMEDEWQRTGSGAEEEGGLFHSISRNNVSTVVQRKWSPAGNLCECFLSVKKNERGHIKMCTCQWVHAFVCMSMQKHRKWPLRLLFLKQCVS